PKHKRGKQLRDGQMHTGHFSSQQIERCQPTINTPDDYRRHSTDENISDPTRPPYLRRCVKPRIIKFTADRAVNDSADRSTAGDKQNNLPDGHKTSSVHPASLARAIKANLSRFGLTTFNDVILVELVLLAAQRIARSSSGDSRAAKSATAGIAQNAAVTSASIIPHSDWSTFVSALSGIFRSNQSCTSSMQ